MAKSKVYLTFFLVFLAGCAVLTGCAGEGVIPGADSGRNAALSNTGLPLLDKELAVEIPALRNQSRGNASGPKIPSGAYSDEFPGIYFIWDSKSADNGYLFVEGAVFNVYESFVLTTKESNEYWDFLIEPQDGQQTAEDGRYIFFLPRASGKNNINMVFLSEWAEKEEDPGDPDDPPGTDPSDDVTVSVSIDYELSSWDGDILVMLTLSEGEWGNFMLWPDYGSMSNPAMVAEKAAIFKWITLSFADTLYNPVLQFVGGGYDYLKIRTSPLESSENRISINPKVLTFRFTYGYMHLAVVIPEEQIAQNFSRHLPITVTINEEKLAEMKARTDISGNLTVGTKSAVLDTLKEPPVVVPPKEDPGNGDDKELPVTDIQYLRLGSSLGPSYPWKYVVLKSTEAGDYSAILRRAEMEIDCGHDTHIATAYPPHPPKYGAKFFEENNLVMVHKAEGSGGNRLEVEKLSVTDNALNITIKRNGNGVTCDMAYWYILIPVSKDYFDGETVNVDIVTIGYSPPVPISPIITIDAL
jgi:hypothetical protein